MQQLSGVGVTVLQGGCLPLTEALPLLPMVEALRGLTRRDDGRLLSDILAAQPKYVLQEIARLLPELGAASGDVSGPGEGWQRERLFTAVRELLAAVAARGLVVLVIEDLHWADRTTLDLLCFLVGSGVPTPVSLAVSCRGDEPVTGSALVDWLAAARSVPGVAELALGPLAPEPAAEQAAALLGNMPSAATLKALYRRTAGNPFFTEQLIAAGLTPVEEGRSAMPATMPAGLAALLSARVRRASPSARQVLAALAVAGRPVDEATLAAVSDLEYEVVEDALIELIEARLVTSDQDAYVPRHQLLADVVTADLLVGRRRALHASFAQRLAERGDSQVAAEIAAHWAAAGREEEELAWSAVAGEAAEAMYAFAEAAQHWERVTQLWETAPAKPPGRRLGQAYIHAIGDRYNCSDSARAALLTESGLARVAEDELYERAVLLGWASI